MTFFAKENVAPIKLELMWQIKSFLLFLIYLCGLGPHVRNQVLPFTIFPNIFSVACFDFNNQMDFVSYSELIYVPGTSTTA